MNTTEVMKRPTYHAQARERWPEAEWVDGNGRWATLARCEVLTVALHKRREDAERALDFLAMCGCGNRCLGKSRHELVDMDAEAMDEDEGEDE